MDYFFCYITYLAAMLHCCIVVCDCDWSIFVALSYQNKSTTILLFNKGSLYKHHLFVSEYYVIVILAQEYCEPALHNNRRIPNQQQVSFSCVTPYTFMMAVGDKYASLYSISPCISIFFDGNWHIFLRNFASAAI